MVFIAAVPEEQATGATEAMYRDVRAAFGYLPNLAKVFSHRPEVMEAFQALLQAVRGRMEPRRYELVTLAAARELRSSYCMLAHGSVMLRDFCDAPTLRAILEDPGRSGLDEAEQAVMRFAALVARDAASVSGADVEELRRHGLDDAQIFDVAAAAAARCFFSKMLDALGARPDAAYAGLAPDLRAVLEVGRPIER